jgi:transcriptional regulator with XRE-family HTH domain
MHLYNAADMAGRPPFKPAPQFGAQLASLRNARGLSQAQFAKILGISAHMLAYYERKATNPSAEFVAKAAQVLKVSTDELLGHKAVRKSGPPSELEQRIAALRELPRERQKLVLQLIDTVLRDAKKAS